MKKTTQAVAPAMCFLMGFVICVLLSPMLSAAGDGESYYEAAAAGSFWNILINNTVMCALFILASGIGSCILLLIQGFSFGGTYLLWTVMGNTAETFFLLFLPHVIFEFVAMALAGYLGFQLLDFILKKNGQTLKGLLREHRWVLAATFAAVWIGALVECYVTPALYAIG